MKKQRGTSKKASNAIYTLTGIRDAEVEVFIPRRFGEDLGGMYITHAPSGERVYDSRAAEREGYDCCLSLKECYNLNISIRPTDKPYAFHLAVPFAVV